MARKDVSKTEAAILERIDSAPHKETVVAHGVARAGNRTGTPRQFGVRELKAAQALVKRGVCEITKQNFFQIAHKGYTDSVYETRLKRKGD